MSHTSGVQTYSVTSNKQCIAAGGTRSQSQRQLTVALSLYRVYDI